MANSGKIFEQSFEKSLCKDIFRYKLRDSGGWSRDSNTRFSTSNICDYVLYNMNTKQMFLLELKSTKGKSLPFGNIKEKQIKGLLDASDYSIVCGFVINLSGECYYLDIKDFNEFYNNTNRKSIPLSLLKEKGIFIPSKLLQKNYRYDLSGLLNEVR